MAHARLSPSNPRWVHCPGSVREETKYPDESSDAAIDGTGTHLLFEMTVHIGSAQGYMGQIIGEGHPDRPGGWIVDQQRIDRVNVAHAYVQRRIKELGGARVYSEDRADPGSIYGREDWWGTCDLALEGIGQQFLEVIDYKDGRGFVSEKNNSQLIGYIVGKMPKDWTYGNYSDIPVRMTIIQPKTSPPIRYEDSTVGQVLEKAGELAKAAKRTDDPDAPLIAGSHCQWCKHGRAGNCPANNQAALGGLEIMTENSGQSTMIEAIKTGQLSVADMPADKLAAVMDASAAIKKLIDQVEAEAMKRLQDNPASVPGYEIGTGRNSKVWAEDEEVVEKKLKGMRFKKADIFPAKLLSPAQALKNPDLNDRQKVKIEEMIKTEPGKPKVVKSKTEAEVVPAEQMFMGIEQIPDFM